jgi:hypothetical protein
MVEQQKKSIHPDIPIETAWQTGRRLYVRTSAKSQLGQWMSANGGHWDRDMTPWGLWVGSTKKAALIPELLAHLERVAAMMAKKATLVPVSIPYERTDLRQIVKDAGGMWDKPNKQWLVAAKVAEQIHTTLAAEVAEAVAIPYEADAVTARARELGARWYPNQRVWRMSVEAAADVRALLTTWQADQRAAADLLRQQRIEQAEREQLALVTASGRVPVEGAESRYWPSDQIGYEGQVLIERGHVYVIVEVVREYDGDDDYTPGHTVGVEVEPNEDDRAEIARRAEIAAIARERKELKEAIRAAGTAPEGHHQIAAPELMSTWNPYGGGDWFCVTDEYAWYVKNNGADGDFWGHNNVRTAGAGAIGWRVDRATANGQALAQRVLDLAARHDAAKRTTADA